MDEGYTPGTIIAGILVGWFLLAGWGTYIGPTIGRWLGTW